MILDSSPLPPWMPPLPSVTAEQLKANRRRLLTMAAVQLSKGRVFVVLATYLWSHCAWDPATLLLELSAERAYLLSRIVLRQDVKIVAFLDPDVLPLPGVVAPGVTPQRLVLEFQGLSPSSPSLKFTVAAPSLAGVFQGLGLTPARFDTVTMIHLITVDDGPFGHRRIFGGRHGATYYWCSQEIDHTVTAASALAALGRATDKRR